MSIICSSCGLKACATDPHLRRPGAFDSIIRVKIETVGAGNTVTVLIEIIDENLTARWTDLPRSRGGKLTR